ncbi:MAG: hypothetical protein EOO09_05870 [Chitinophagaceae bacterium]|nr:MAG: hypothetical protein EOO09_05870 [Chitinophagaceae bacterium]
MQDKIFDISFTSDGVLYEGWVNPSGKQGADGKPASFHVVLNKVSFGYLAYHDCKWTVNEERPARLVEAAGKEIEKHFEL